MKSINVDLLLVQLLLLNNSETILQVFLLIKLEEWNLTMTLVLLDGVKKMELNIGLFVTHGDLTGVKEEHSELLEESITLTLKEIALGLYPLIPGQMI
jgi:hypothetical protein